MPARLDQEDRTEGYQEQTALKNGLNTRHRQLMRELLGGATIAQAAARCNFSIGRVRQVKSSELFKKEMERMEEELDSKTGDRLAEDMSVSQTLKEASSDAADTLVTAATTGAMNSLRVSSAKDLLDRTGHKAPTDIIAELSIDADEGLKHMLAGLIAEKEKGIENEVD